MSKTETGGAAFPVATECYVYSHGMTLREYYAGRALGGLLANAGPEQPSFAGVEECLDYYAKLSFLYADAMLRARGGTNAE